MKNRIDVLQYVNDSVAHIAELATKKHPERGWMTEVQRLYWDSVSGARGKGIPLILHSPSFPPELIYAFGAVPLCLDSLVARLASLEMGVAPYVDLAHKYIPDHICSLNKTGIGLALSGDMASPDGLIYAALPCDSARIAYPLIAEHLDVPHFCVDTPYEQNERGYGYVANEMRGATRFLEEVTGKKLDWNRLVKVIEYSNEAYELISQIADLRKIIPCPLPGKLLVLNQVFGFQIGSRELAEFLKAQYDMGKEKVQRKEGWLKEEKFRVAWIQNPIWFDVGIYDWMEKEYGAIVTMDAFGFQESLPVANPWDEAEVYRVLGKRLLRSPMPHRSSGPAEFWMEAVTQIISEYKCNAAIFTGHVGCKHTWAVAKVIKDMVSDRFGISTLTFDVDGLDPRYRGSESIKNKIKDFMEMIQ
jgi:benzoyl-CoA reductase/2-hydroxyglutaryl-CoA dehydratase subunit BcrC/BadD/HgdB